MNRIVIGINVFIIIIALVIISLFLIPLVEKSFLSVWIEDEQNNAQLDGVAITNWREPMISLFADEYTKGDLKMDVLIESENGSILFNGSAKGFGGQGESIFLVKNKVLSGKVIVKADLFYLNKKIDSEVYETEVDKKYG